MFTFTHGLVSWKQLPQDLTSAVHIHRRRDASGSSVWTAQSAIQSVWLLDVKRGPCCSFMGILNVSSSICSLKVVITVPWGIQAYILSVISPYPRASSSVPCITISVLKPFWDSITSNKKVVLPDSFSSCCYGDSPLFLLVWWSSLLSPNAGI